MGPKAAPGMPPGCFQDCRLWDRVEELDSCMGEGLGVGVAFQIVVCNRLHDYLVSIISINRRASWGLTSEPRWVHQARTAARLPMVPLLTNSAASIPQSRAAST